MSALDVLAAAQAVGGSWPTVLRPASVAQRLDAAESARKAGWGPTADRSSTSKHSAVRGEGLCDRVMGFAGATLVRSVHWFLGPRGTLIAESAWGSGVSAVLVGWAPHEDEGAQDVAGEAGRHAANHRAPLPGALLLGVFDTADTARRLAELVPESAHADIAVVGRWALPGGCPPMSVHSVVHPEPGVLRRELVTQVSEAFLRVQADAAQEGAQEGAQQGAQARTQDSHR